MRHYSQEMGFARKGIYKEGHKIQQEDFNNEISLRPWSKPFG